MKCKGPLKAQVAARAPAHLVGAGLLLLLACGCSSVKPWQREQLADPIMQPDRYPLASALSDHVYFSREAASGTRTIGGGGCGCN